MSMGSAPPNACAAQVGANVDAAAVPDEVVGTPTMVGVPVQGKGQDVHTAFNYQHSVASAWWQQWYQWYAKNYSGVCFQPLGAVPSSSVMHAGGSSVTEPPPSDASDGAPVATPHRNCTASVGESAGGDRVQEQAGRQKHKSIDWVGSTGPPAVPAPGADCSVSGTVTVHSTVVLPTAGVDALKAGKGNSSKVCKNCGTVCTPFWRKDQSDLLPLCNACGLYAKKNGAMRPPNLWKQDKGVFAFSSQPLRVSSAPLAGGMHMPPMRMASSAQPLAMQIAHVMGLPCFQAGVPVTFMHGSAAEHAGLPSAADLLTGTFSDADMPPPRQNGGMPHNAFSVPMSATPILSGAGAGAPPRTAAAHALPTSTLPPLPPLAPMAPVAPPSGDASEEHPPVLACGPGGDSMVMQVSASLTRAPPADGLGAPALALPADDLDDIDMFYEAVHAIGVHDDEDLAMQCTPPADASALMRSTAEPGADTRPQEGVKATGKEERASIAVVRRPLRTAAAESGSAGPAQ